MTLRKHQHRVTKYPARLAFGSDEIRAAGRGPYVLVGCGGALDIVTVDQDESSPLFQNQLQLPHQIVHVLDA